MLPVAVVGANGYIGKAIVETLYLQNTDPDRKEILAIYPITRENYEEAKKEKYHYIINSAMPSKRFWALANPELDYIETVEKTRDLVENWSYNKFIQISSVSARCENNTVYGQHKLLAENLVKQAVDSLILRIVTPYHTSNTKGIIYDIINNNKLYVSGDSRYAFSSLDFISYWISRNLDKSGIIDLGAKNSVSLKEISDSLGLDLKFGDRLEIQEVENPGDDYPDVNKVISFIQEEILDYE